MTLLSRQLSATTLALGLLASGMAHAELKVRFQSCGTELRERITAAYQHLHFRVTRDRAEMISCLDDAYLLEHDQKSARYIVDRLANFRNVMFRCRKINSADGRAHEIKRNVGDIKLDRDYVRSAKRANLAGLIGHELAHNLGFRHKTFDKGSVGYGNTVPEQVLACVRRGSFNPYRGPGRDFYQATDVLGIGLDGEDNMMFAWYGDGTVSAGTSTRIHNYRAPYDFTVAPGVSRHDIVGTGIDGENNMVFAWLRNGKAIAGRSNDLNATRPVPYDFDIPSRYTTADIVGMATDGRANRHYAYFDDGMVYEGSSDNITRNGRRYYLPAPYRPRDVVGMAYDGENKWVFAFYRDGKVSAGTTTHPFVHRAPARVETGR